MLQPHDYLIVDIATAAIESAGEFIEEPTAPSNYRDEQKIAAYVAEKKRDLLDRCALDPDLGRLTAVGVAGNDYEEIRVCQTDEDELSALMWLVGQLHDRTLVTFSGLRFDLPVIMRRGLYHGVSITIDVDRYRTRHVDLLELLTQRGVLPSHSLGFYVRRLGWADLVKPLSGAEEARVLQTGRWAELEASLHHDLTATKRLGQWMGVLPRTAQMGQAGA